MRETPRARQAWLDYLAMGPARSFAKLAECYRDSTGSVPKSRLSVLKHWSQAHHWQDRLADIAHEDQAQIEQHARERRATILDAGFGRMEERVAALKEQAERVVAALDQLDYLRANTRQLEVLFDALHTLFDDIAKEKGERRPSVDVNMLLREETERYARLAGLPVDEVYATAQRLLAGQPP